MRLFNIKGKQSTFIVGFFYLCYHFLIPLDFIFNFIPYLPDSDIYSYIFKNDFKPSSMPTSLTGFYYFITIFKIFLGKNILAYLSFQIFVYFTSILIFLKAWELLYQQAFKETFRQFFLTLSLLLPTSLLYALVALREAFALFAFAVTIYFLILLYKKAKVINTGFLSGIVLVFFTRMQIVFYFILTFLGLKVALDKNLARKILVLFVGVALFIGLILVTNYQISPQKLEYARNYRVDYYANTYGKVNWKSYKDILVDAPILTSQFLLAPLPIMHTKQFTQYKLATLDVLILMFILIVVILNLPSLVKHHKFWLGLVFIYLLLFGIYEFNILGAVRHRLPLTILLIALSTSKLATLFTKRIQYA